MSGSHGSANLKLLQTVRPSRDGFARVDGASLLAARRRKEVTHPERRNRTKLVVFGCEVGGRRSEAQVFLRGLAIAKAGSEPARLRSRARQAWRLRWAIMLAWLLFPGTSERSGFRRRTRTTSNVIGEARHGGFLT